MSLLTFIRRLLGRDGGVLTAKQRRIISTRTKEGLARARSRGVRLGRPSGISDEVRARIVAERASKSLRAIADGLNADAVPTAQGGRWWPSTVQFVLEREAEIKGSA